jgi:hypothetical protein
VVTLTWGVPTEAISADGITARTPVGPMNRVVRLSVRGLPFHWTAEHGAIPLPLTVRKNALAPAAALAGTSEVMAGTGSAVGAVIVENGRELEVIVELDTEIAAVPGNAVSVAETVAVSCVALTNVVGRGDPFQFTTSPSTKFVPFTTSVNPVVPQYGVEVGASDVTVGATIENVIGPDVPPPGAGVNTVTCAFPFKGMSAAIKARSADGTAATSCAGLLYEVANAMLFHCTTEQGTKLLPVTARLNPAVPAVAEDGESETMTGTGSEVGVVVEKFMEFEVAEPLDTVMAAVTLETTNAAGMVAISCAGTVCVAGTNVVASGVVMLLPRTCHWTTDALMKFVPFTVSVKSVGLQYDVEDAETEVMVGPKIAKVIPVEEPPPGPGVARETAAFPAARRSAAGTVARSWAEVADVAGTYVVASGVVTLPGLVHRATEQGRKLVLLLAAALPVMVSVNPALPATAEVTESGDGKPEPNVGGARFVVGVVMVKVTGAEVAVGLDTVTAAGPGKAVSVAKIAAVSWVALTKFVARGVPFQLTTEAETKLAPFTTSVNPDAPQ